MANMLITRVPFSGFYGTIWESEIDQEMERFCEYEADEREAENGIPQELRLSESEFSDILFRCFNSSIAHEKIAEWYVSAYSETVKAETGIDLHLRYESMSSPKYYNFETDRLFAYIPEKTVKALFALSKKEKHERLKARVKECFTSRSGFISHYSNDILDDEWSCPVTDWDHNQICTLIEAIAGIDESDNWEALYYRTFGDEGGYQAFESAVDWKAFDETVSELRDEKAEELRAEMEANGIEWIPPYRCPETLDLFAGVANV